MLTADFHTHGEPYKERYTVDIVSGPQTGPEGSLIEEVRERGVKLTIMPEMRREISPLNDLRAIVKLREMMRMPDGQPRYDVVHTHSSKAGVLARMAAKLAGVPLIVHTVHGWSFHDRMSAKRRAIYVGLEKLGARMGDAMIVVSPKDIEKGLAQGIGKREDYTVIRSGIELDRFGHPQVSRAEMRRALGIPQDALVVGSVTRLSPQKAPLDLVEAFGEIARHEVGGGRAEALTTSFVIVGDGPLRAEVEQRLTELGIADRTILTGLRRDVPELMATFDIFVLSSLWEGLPRVLPQAMASSLPIVCTLADGSSEAVREGINGFLVPRSEPAALAAKVNFLLADAELRQRMGEEGQKLAPEFGAAKMVQEIDALYRRLLARPPCLRS
jgi:glycosyltransferase involved in cell wall biosynthesis